MAYTKICLKTKCEIKYNFKSNKNKTENFLLVTGPFSTSDHLS